MRRTDRLGLMAGLALMAVGGGARAQTTTTPAPPPTDVSRQGGDLSDKLNATGGVIHPETPVDPAMQKVPPRTGAMPVVPPPGSPGGSPDVIPK